MYNENCRNLEIILSILLFTSEGTGSAIREATQHEEKDTIITCIDFNCKYVAWCVQLSKDDAKAKGKENATSSSNGKQVLNLTELSEIPSMDASLASDSASSTALNNTMEGLYRIGKDQKRVPGIAEDVQKLEDGKKYIFKLRKDAKWSNGEAVTAKDFVYSWKRAVNPDTKATYSYIMFDIKMQRKFIKKNYLLTN